MNLCRAGYAVAMVTTFLLASNPIQASADGAVIQQTTPVPSATDLISPRVPEQSTAPIAVTKVWRTTVKGPCNDAEYLFGRMYCASHAEYPLLHWNFENTSDKVATAIRFQVSEVSAFGETLGSLTSDLTGKFSPNINIESRANYNLALRGDGTHWEIRVLKVLWSNGSIWEQGTPLPVTSAIPAPSPSTLPSK